MGGDFPVDPGVRVITFPCYLVRSEDGGAFACQAIGGGRYVIVLLTDEDSLNRYRHDLGVPERGAVKFATPAQLLAALRTFPPEVTGVCFDLARRTKGGNCQTVRLVPLQSLREQVASLVGA